MLKTAVIGLGRQSLDDHIPAVIESELLDLVAVCDIDQSIVRATAEKFKVEGFDNVKDLVGGKCDVAIVAVPHNQYLPIVSALADAGIHIIKEKPFATNIDEACSIHKAVNGKVFLGVVSQRRFNPIYQTFPQMQRRIGKIYSIEGKYTLNIADLDEGWRASKAHAGGGALLDMGYHLIDLLVWYFGVPQTVTARITRGNRPDQEYDVEDTANMLFDLSFPQSYEEKTVGNILISRVYPKKQEILTVYGVKGIVELQRGQICRYDVHGQEVEKLVRHEGWPSAFIDQFNHFVKAIESGNRWSIETLKEYLPHVAIIQAAYDSDSRSTSCQPAEYLKKALEVCNE